MPGRAVRNEFVKRLEKGETKAVTQCYQCLSHCNPKEIPYCITEALIRAVSGDIKEGLIFCGGYSYMSKKIESVKEVIDSLMNLDV